MPKKDQMDQPKTGKIGNTGQSCPKRGPLGDRWLFCFNNYSESDLDRLDQILQDNENVLNGCYGLELAPTTGTAHVQGYIEFVKRKRPREMAVFDRRIHWGDEDGFPCKKHCTQVMNMEYCSKTRDIDETPNEVFKTFRCKLKRKLVLIKPSQFYEWQRDLAKIFSTHADPHCRKIYWYYGGYQTGKTQFAKWLIHNRDGYNLGGETRHMLSQAYKFEHDLYVVLLPNNKRKVSYEAIEQIKDGCFSSGFGTECNGMAPLRNAPHFLILGNEPPDYRDPDFHPEKYHVFRLADDHEAIRQ